MSDWIIETKRNCFENETLELVIQDAINFYCEVDKEPEQITQTYCIGDESEILQEVCQAEIDKIEERIETEYRYHKKQCEIEAEGFRKIQSDYFLNLI